MGVMGYKKLSVLKRVNKLNFILDPIDTCSVFL